MLIGQGSSSQVCLACEDGTYRLSRNVGIWLQINAV